MKRLIFAIVVVMLAGQQAAAQEPGPTDPLDGINPSPTQEMWFYLQEMRRYDDPQIAIRRKEERKAEQRRLRLATMKWFGFSGGRPVANPVPYYGVAAPSWVGNGHNSYNWIGGGTYYHTARIERVRVETERR